MHFETEVKGCANDITALRVLPLFLCTLCTFSGAQSLAGSLMVPRTCQEQSLSTEPRVSCEHCQMCVLGVWPIKENQNLKELKRGPEEISWR